MSTRRGTALDGAGARLLCSLLCAATVFALSHGDAGAQYFGRDKVKYETFDFKKLQTSRFDIYYYPAEEEAARVSGLMLEKWYDRLSSVFGIRLKESRPVVLYANHADFQQTNLIPGIISQGTGGFTEGMKSRIVRHEPVVSGRLEPGQPGRRLRRGLLVLRDRLSGQGQEVQVRGRAEPGLVDFPYPPTEIAPFLDAGIAWTGDEEPAFDLTTRSSDRIPVFSTGVALRFLILGSLVTQLYYAHPFQRPEKGGHVRFVILNGW